jgi:proteasome lid subunit RPN8/RPN11
MRYFANEFEVECGGWGIAPACDRPLIVKDIALIKQVSSTASIDFEDEGVVSYMEDMAELGYNFPQFMRVWVHTHPGNSASPSPTDNDTFLDLAKTLPFVVMLIIARGGDTHAELGYFTAGHFFSAEIPVEIDWRADSWKEWDDEYHDNVIVKKYSARVQRGSGFQGGYSSTDWRDEEEWVPNENGVLVKRKRGDRLRSGASVYDPDDAWDDAADPKTQDLSCSDPTPSPHSPLGKARKKETSTTHGQTSPRSSSDVASVVIPASVVGEMSHAELEELSKKVYEGTAAVDYDALSEDDWKALVAADASL